MDKIYKVPTLPRKLGRISLDKSYKVPTLPRKLGRISLDKNYKVLNFLLDKNTVK